MHKYLQNKTYEEWLRKIELDEYINPTTETVPSLTYFFVRSSDKKIIGMTTLRLCLNEKYKIYAGNIGYSIRPTERNKGYNKINLYLALMKFKEYGLEQIFLGCKKNNLPSKKTMLSLGATKIEEFEYKGNLVEKYTIDVEKSIEDNKRNYDIYVDDCNNIINKVK